jgi:hypothetical protein
MPLIYTTAPAACHPERGEGSPQFPRSQKTTQSLPFALLTKIGELQRSFVARERQGLLRMTFQGLFQDFVSRKIRAQRGVKEGDLLSSSSASGYLPYLFAASIIVP